MFKNDIFYNIEYDENEKVTKRRNESTPLCNSIRGIIILMTIAISIYKININFIVNLKVVCVILNYHFKLKILKLKRLRLEEDNLYSAGLIPKLLLEMFICSICCPPYFDYTFRGDVLSGTYEYRLKKNNQRI